MTVSLTEAAPRPKINSITQTLYLHCLSLGFSAHAALLPALGHCCRSCSCVCSEPHRDPTCEVLTGPSSASWALGVFFQTSSLKIKIIFTLLYSWWLDVSTNITRRIAYIHSRFKESFRPTFLYINRLEGQICVHIHIETSLPIYIYLHIHPWVCGNHLHTYTVDVQCECETAKAHIVS